MYIIYSALHARHAPRRQVEPGGDKAYPEKPARASRILRTIRQGELGKVIRPRSYPAKELATVHDRGYLSYLASVYAEWVAEGLPASGVVPLDFPGRSMRGRPGGRTCQAGYYSFDACTPIVAGTFGAAVASASCALTGADLLLEGERLVYALCRPPGHHAGRDYCGGYCYLNNAALAAARLSDRHAARRVAILDIDFHHGNGTQDIFYGAGHVLYVSLHGDPNVAYPYYSGYADERGEGSGLGFNLNLPLPLNCRPRRYLAVLARGLDAISRFDPAFLVVSFGGDTVETDPVGGLGLPVESFSRIGRLIARLSMPKLIVQEGGYDLGTLGRCVALLLSALQGR